MTSFFFIALLQAGFIKNYEKLRWSIIAKYSGEWNGPLYFKDFVYVVNCFGPILKDPYLHCAMYCVVPAITYQKHLST